MDCRVCNSILHDAEISEFTDICTSCARLEINQLALESDLAILRILDTWNKIKLSNKVH
jgi:hypothetical protein